MVGLSLTRTSATCQQKSLQIFAPEILVLAADYNNNIILDLLDHLYDAVVVLGVLAEHDGALAVGAEGGDQAGLQHRPQLVRQVEDRRLRGERGAWGPQA